MSHKYGGTISPNDYLKVEEAASSKSEYISGRMFAMSGASTRHDRIIMNLILSLGPIAAKFNCDLFTSNVKLKIESLKAFYYPDLMLSCESDCENSLFASAPSFILEVLSPSTESIDRREKLLAYRVIKSVREYMIVSQNTRQVELYRKNTDTEWIRYEFTDNADVVTLTSFPGGDVQLPLSLIYARTKVDK